MSLEQTVDPLYRVEARTQDKIGEICAQAKSLSNFAPRREVGKTLPVDAVEYNLDLAQRKSLDPLEGKSDSGRDGGDGTCQWPHELVENPFCGRRDVGAKSAVFCVDHPKPWKQQASQYTIEPRRIVMAVQNINALLPRVARYGCRQPPVHTVPARDERDLHTAAPGG